MQVTETIKLVAAIAIGAAVLFGYQTVMGWKQAADQNEQRGRTMESTSGITKDGDDSAQARQAADTGVAQGRQTFEDTIDEDSNNEPATATRDSGTVPDSRLRAFERRRLERERHATDRLRRAGVERQERSGSSDPAER